MNMNDLEKELRQMQYTFSSSFEEEITAKIKDIQAYRLPQIRWFISGVAACLLLCAVIIYYQDGILNYDSVLGLSDLNADDISTYITYQ